VDTGHTRREPAVWSLSEDRSIRLAAGNDQTALDAESAGLGDRKDIMNPIDRNGSGASPRKKYDETYKRHAVELTLHGDRTVKTVAKELGSRRGSCTIGASCTRRDLVAEGRRRRRSRRR